MQGLLSHPPLARLVALGLQQASRAAVGATRPQQHVPPPAWLIQPLPGTASGYATDYGKALSQLPDHLLAAHGRLQKRLEAEALTREVVAAKPEPAAADSKPRWVPKFMNFLFKEKEDKPAAQASEDDPQWAQLKDVQNLTVQQWVDTMDLQVQGTAEPEPWDHQRRKLSLEHAFYRRREQQMQIARALTPAEAVKIQRLSTEKMAKKRKFLAKIGRRCEPQYWAREVLDFVKAYHRQRLDLRLLYEYQQSGKRLPSDAYDTHRLMQYLREKFAPDAMKRILARRNQLNCPLQRKISMLRVPMKRRIQNATDIVCPRTRLPYGQCCGELERMAKLRRNAAQRDAAQRGQRGNVAAITA